MNIWGRRHKQIDQSDQSDRATRATRVQIDFTGIKADWQSERERVRAGKRGG